MFKVGQIVEKIHYQEGEGFKKALLGRFISDEAILKEMMELSDNKVGDKYEVYEIRCHTDKNNAKHELYLCKNLRTQEFALFGSAGLKALDVSDSKI